MRLEYYGDGAPEVAFLGLVHGDEPCGGVALDHVRTRARAGDLEGSVLVIYANEKAAERGERTALWADPDRERGGTAGDLNRAYGGDGPTPAAPAYEERLASVIEHATADLPVYDLHATTSAREQRFAIFSTEDVPESALTAYERRVAATGVDTALDFRIDDGSGVRRLHTVEVEHLQKGSRRAVAQARRTVDTVLANHGLTDEDPPTPERIEVREVLDHIEPDSEYVRVEPADALEDPEAGEWEIVAEGFERLEAGDPIARAEDGSTVRAVTAFTPVMLSRYEDRFGYVTEHAGSIEAT